MLDCKYINYKDEYIAVDFFKFIFSFFIISIHIPAFEEINPELSFWLNQVLARVAVPYYFIVTGYFLGKEIDNKNRIFRYIYKMLKLYTLYTAIYIPQILYEYLKKQYGISDSIIMFLKNFLFVGSYTQFWYFLAIITSISILYIMRCYLKINLKNIAIFSIVVYILGVLGLVFQNDINDIPIISKYFEIFHTTRNGFFFGLLFVFIGYVIRINNLRIEPIKYSKILLISFLLMNVEVYLIIKNFPNAHLDIVFTTPIVCTFLFLTIASMKCKVCYKKIALKLRNLSTLIFTLHMFVRFYLKFIIEIILGYEISTTILFVFVSLLTLFLSLLILYKSKQEKFHILKKLYN